MVGFMTIQATTSSTQQGQDVPDRRRRLLALIICSISLLLVGLDATIVNVALPAMRRSFHGPVSGLQWIVDAYTLVLAKRCKSASDTCSMPLTDSF